ncbi:MAG: hypothetical protein ACT4RN_07970 [Pseudonocardia sp.]
MSFADRDAARARAVHAVLERGASRIVFWAVLVLGAAAAGVLLRLDPASLVYFGDAASHLVATRKLVDWGDGAGLGQLGTVWLPVPHLMLLPFAVVGPLFSTGLAGLAVSLTCLALTAALLCRLLREALRAPAWLGIVGAMVYALNPNIAYLGMTAMTEAPFMLFFVASAYWLHRWSRAPQGLRGLALCSVFVVLATLCRYEGWILPLFLVVTVAVLATRADLAAPRGLACVAIAILSGTGIAVWLAYNAYQYGDPLEFADAQFYSAASQAQERDIRENLLLQPGNVVRIYGATAAVVYGPVLLGLALIGLVRLLRRRGRDVPRIGWPAAYLAAPPLFTLASLLVGIGEMTFWFNSRFLILLAPLLILLAVSLAVGAADRAAPGRDAVVVGVAAWLVVQIAISGLGAVPVHLDARGGYGYHVNPSAVATGEALRAAYDGGKIVIMTGSAQEHRIMLTAGVPLGQYDEILHSSTWKGAYSAPWRYGRWLVLSRSPDSDAGSVGEYWNARRDVLDERYDTVFRSEFHEILRRRDG